MNISTILSGFLLVSVFLSVFAGPIAKSENKKRRHGCRCKRIYKQLSRTIDSKFKDLEQKFLTHLPQADQSINDSLSLKEINNKMGRLHGDVQNTREALKHESQALLKVKEQIFAQKKSMDNLNDHFDLLETVVKNLTDVIGRLGGVPIRVDPAPLTTEVTSSKKDVITTAAPPKEKPASLRTYPRHCQDVYKHGGLRYQGDYYIMIQPERTPAQFKVVCKQINESGGWTVIQRRQDGSINFYRNWAEYKQGFGHLSGEFWLGNENIYHLTNSGPTRLRIDMELWNGSKYYAIYDYFRIDSEIDFYKLHVRGYHGTAGDSLTSMRDNHNGMHFSTKDKDNDRRGYNNCAEHYKGGWWYSDCYDSNLNGQYYKRGKHINFFQRNGIHWNSIHMHSSLKFVEMSVQPADDASSQNKV